MPCTFQRLENNPETSPWSAESLCVVIIMQPASKIIAWFITLLSYFRNLFMLISSSFPGITINFCTGIYELLYWNIWTTARKNLKAKSVYSNSKINTIIRVNIATLVLEKSCRINVNISTMSLPPVFHSKM